MKKLIHSWKQTWFTICFGLFLISSFPLTATGARHSLLSVITDGNRTESIKILKKFQKHLREALPHNQSTGGTLQHVSTSRCLSAREEIKTRDEEGNTPLILAAEKGYLEEVQRLFRLGAQMEAENNSGSTAFHAAVGHRHLAVASFLADYGANVSHRNSAGDTPLIVATRGGVTAFADLILTKEGDLELLNHEGDTALLVACRNNQLAIAKSLIAAGSDIQAMSAQDDKSCLSLAIGKENQFFVPLFLEEMAKLPETARRPEVLNAALIQAALVGKLDWAESLIELGANQETLAETKIPLLVFAAQKNQKEMVDFLIRAGVPVENSDSNNGTPLIWAVSKASIEVVEALLRAGANPNAQYRDGRTPLHYAVSYGKKDIARMLLENGADLRMPAKDGTLPVYLAISGNYPSLLPVLLEGNWVGSEQAIPTDYARYLREKNAPLTLAKLEYFLASQQVQSFDDIKKLKATIKAAILDAKEKMKRGEEASKRKEEIIYYQWLIGKKLLDQSRLLHLYSEIKEMKAEDRHEKTCPICLEHFSVFESDFIGKGPARCDCFICEDCAKDWIDSKVRDSGGNIIRCPTRTCRGILDPKFLVKNRRTEDDISKLCGVTVSSWRAQDPDWVFCGSNNCNSGRAVKEGEDAYFSCAVCDWEGCLTCKTNHRGDCQKAVEENEETKKRITFLLEQGRLAPPKGGHPEKPRDPDKEDPEDPYFFGRYRPCNYCGTITEKAGNGVNEAGQCNSMVCGNKKCKKEWHWNWGDHAMHPQNTGGQRIHDYVRDVRHYEPLEEAHF